MKNKSDSTNFDIDRNTPIIIYGAAGNGLRGYHSLKKINNYNIIGFIDKRSDEIKRQFGLPVWNIDAILPYNKDMVLVVICIKNVFEHEKIASELIENQYNNIIFKPLQSLMQETKINYTAIDRNYQRIFNDADKNSKYNLESIPKLKNIQVYNYRDYAIISRDGDRVISNIPLSEIYIKMSNLNFFLCNEDGFCNILALVPHINLFQFFNGKNGNIDDYLKFCISTIPNSKKLYGNGGNIEITSAWLNNIIRNRIIVFNNMSIDVEIDVNYFINYAPKCYLGQNYIVMNSAKHRAAFNIVKGKKYMPIAITSDDYKKLLNLTILQELIEFLNSNKIHELNAPIQHPYLYKYPCKMSNYYELFVNKVVFQIASIYGFDNNLKQITVEDSLIDEGSLSRCLYKIGFHIKKIIYNDTDRKLCKILDRLFYISDIEYSDRFNGAEIICCTTKELDKIVHFNTTKMLIVLGEDKFYLRNDNFILKSKMFVTIWDQKVIAGYFYLNKSKISK